MARINTESQRTVLGIVRFSARAGVRVVRQSARYRCFDP